MVDIVANLRNKMKKLQTALLKSGVIIKINQNQFYSEDQKRMITQYRLMKPEREWSDKKQAYVIKDKEILKSCSVVEVINYLLQEYRQVNSG